jgi:hypothetical protein
MRVVVLLAGLVPTRIFVVADLARLAELGDSRQASAIGKLTEGLTVFALKGGNLMRRVGINEFESGNMALEAAHSTRHL